MMRPDLNNLLRFLPHRGHPIDWLRTKFTSSFFALFAAAHPAEVANEPHCGLEEIREAMLAQLDGIQNPTFRRRVTYACDVQGLWYLRGDLMSLLAAKVGEARAQEEIVRITAMFQHLLPSGLRSRPSPFNTPSRIPFQDSDTQ